MKRSGRPAREKTLLLLRIPRAMAGGTSVAQERKRQFLPLSYAQAPRPQARAGGRTAGSGNLQKETPHDRSDPSPSRRTSPNHRRRLVAKGATT